MAGQYDQTSPPVEPVESTGRGYFGFGGKKTEDVVESDSAADKVHAAEVEPKKESGGGILGMFGFGAKKKEEVPSENEFSSEAPDTVQATEVEHESSGRGLIGTKDEGVKPGSAFSSEPVEKVHFSEDAEPKHHSDTAPVESTDRGLFGLGGKKEEEVPTANKFSSESDEKVHFPSEDVKPKNPSDTGAVESTDRGLFGLGGKKAEEVPTENKFSSKSDEKVHFPTEDVKPKHESFGETLPTSDTGSVGSTDRGLFGFGGKKAEEVRTENTINPESDEKVHFSEDVEPKHESLVKKPHPSDIGSVESADRGLFGFGGKKAEEVRTENTFNPESDEKVHFSEDVEPKHETLAEKLHPSDTGSVESTDRSLFGFGGKKAEDVRSENTFNSESDEKVHETLLENMHRSDQERTDERTSDRDAFSSGHETKLPVSKVEPYQTGESTDRGLFGLGGKKKEEIDSEQAFNSEFEQKVQVSETEPQKESMLQKLHRSDSSASSSSDEEEVAEGGVKKKKLKEKIKDKVKGTDKKPEEANIYHEEQTSIPSYTEVPLPVHQAAQPEEKKSFMEKMKDKLPGHKKNDDSTPTSAAVEPPVSAVDHGPISPVEEKKGFLSKIKDKLHHSKTDEEKEIEKEKNQY